MFWQLVIGLICWSYVIFSIAEWIQDYRDKKKDQKWQKEYDELVKSFGPSTYKGFIPWPLTHSEDNKK